MSFIFVVGITVIGVFLSLRNSSANASKAAQVQMGGSVVFERSEIDSMSQFAQAGSGKAIELDPLLKKLEQLQMTALSRLGPGWLHLDEETWFQARESESSHIAQDGTDETALSHAYSNSNVWQKIVDNDFNLGKEFLNVVRNKEREVYWIVGVDKEGRGAIRVGEGLNISALSLQQAYSVLEFDI